MEGSGLPLAWHIRVMLEPSFTTTSLDRLVIFGGTVKENQIYKIQAVMLLISRGTSEKGYHYDKCHYHYYYYYFA